MRHVVFSLVALVGLVLVLPSPLAHHGDDRANYITFGGLSIWCGPGGHPIVPQGDPAAYDAPEQWLVSGEPECAPGDLLLGTDEDHGLGGVGFYPFYNEFGSNVPYRDHRGENAVLMVDDVLFDDVAVRLRIESPNWPDDDGIDIESCGGIVPFVVPPFANSHWLGETQLAWAQMPPVMVTADQDVCFASQGSIEVTYESG